MVTGALNKGKKSWRTKIFFSLPLMKMEVGVLGAVRGISAGLMGGTGTAGSATGETSGACGASAALDAGVSAVLDAWAGGGSLAGVVGGSLRLGRSAVSPLPSATFVSDGAPSDLSAGLEASLVGPADSFVSSALAEGASLFLSSGRLCAVLIGFSPLGCEAVGTAGDC